MHKRDEARLSKLCVHGWRSKGPWMSTAPKIQVSKEWNIDANHKPDGQQWYLSDEGKKRYGQGCLKRGYPEQVVLGWHMSQG
jgi:hypothetical protein